MFQNLGTIFYKMVSVQKLEWIQVLMFNIMYIGWFDFNSRALKYVFEILFNAKNYCQIWINKNISYRLLNLNKNKH